MRVVRTGNIHDQMSYSLETALAPVEYGYYFVISYAVFGPALGLILMGGIGSGFLLVPLLAYCFFALKGSALTVLQRARLPLACGTSYLFIQLVLHEESLYGAYVYQFGPWLMTVAIVQSLVMYRQNFLHRFAWFTLFIGICMVPYMSFGQIGAIERMKLDREAGVFANPNALAAWFGFCALYFIIKGFVVKSQGYRFVTWFIAVGSMYAVALTVSRGALIAVAASLVVSSRKLVRAGFVPVVLLGIFLIALMEIGVFDGAMESFGRRGVEDTGRLQVWPLLIEQFANSPLIGNGASRAGAYTGPGIFRTPHNSFLLLAVASGIVPLVLFMGYCFQSGITALRADVSDPDCPFYLPLVTYAVLVTCAGNLDFMASWAVVSLAVPRANGISRRIDQAGMGRPSLGAFRSEAAV